jgi:hypothetical protein
LEQHSFGRQRGSRCLTGVTGPQEQAPMQPTLSPKSTDDPCDDVVVVPDAVRIAPSDVELADLLQQAARHRLAIQAATAADVKPDPAAPPIDLALRAPSADDEQSSRQEPLLTGAPPIDVMDRPAPANDDQAFGRRRSWGRQAARALIVMLLATGIGLAAAAWKSHGAAVTKMIAGLAAQLVVGSSAPEQSAVAAEPAPPAAAPQAPNAAPEQPVPTAQTAPAPDATVPAAAASADQTELLQSMTRDLATLQQQVEELKGSMERLKASQQQMSRDVAKAAEPKPRPKTPTAAATMAPTTAPTAPPHSAAVQVKKPVRSSSPQQGFAAAPALSQAPAPYYGPSQRYLPPQPEPPPQTTTGRVFDDDAWAPRPPMPVR